MVVVIWSSKASFFLSKKKICDIFREMRCLRNKIHANLFLTYILANSFWLATYSASESGVSFPIKLMNISDDDTQNTPFEDYNYNWTRNKVIKPTTKKTLL